MAAHSEYGRGRFEEAVRAFQRVLEQPAESPALAAYQADSALEGLTVTYTRLPDGDRRARDAFQARLGEAGAVERLVTMARLLETTDADAGLRLYGRLVDEHAATLPSESLRALLQATSELEGRAHRSGTSPERLERLSARADLSVASRVEVLLALARAHVAQGDRTDAARAALRTAKGLLPPTPAAPGATESVPSNLGARVALGVAMLDLEALSAEPALPADSPRRLEQVLEDDQRKADALERLIADALAREPALTPEGDALRVRLLARVADRCVAALAASPEGPNASRVAARERAARGEAERLLAHGHIDTKSAAEAQALLRARRP
jgi:tetratricopeptide (TPR) repeat protein